MTLGMIICQTYVSPFYYERSTKKVEVIYAIYERKDGIEFLKPFQGGLAYNV